MTTFAKEPDRIVCQHTVKARWAEDFIPVLNALYDTANKLASEADRHPWKEDATDKRRARGLGTIALADDTFG